jgi:hypothetical protein
LPEKKPPLDMLPLTRTVVGTMLLDPVDATCGALHSLGQSGKSEGESKQRLEQVIGLAIAWRILETDCKLRPSEFPSED